MTTFALGPRQVPVWPQDQSLTSIDSSIRWTQFADHQTYHQDLVRAVLAEEAKEWGDRQSPSRSLGGRKVHHIDTWDSAAANLVHARAMELFKRAVGSQTAVVDLSWANVYRKHDYISPHAHRRTVASVVYMVDPGDEDGADPLAGRLCFVDPRLDVCCQDQKGFMTTPVFPEMPAGAMVIFPAEVVHCVTPYEGDRPRITFAWNISRKAVAGTASDEARGIPARPKG
jgi:hypothetical protein